MKIVISALVLLGVSEIAFYFLHRRPLTDEEIKTLMQKRRRKYFKKYFKFKATNSYPDKSFKSSMRAGGDFYSTDIKITDFPSYVSNLLKGKKHEWIVFGFVRDDKVVAIYANKGYDNSSATANISTDMLIDSCLNLNCHTLLRFHNHPNSDPKHYTCLGASSDDKASSKYYSGITLKNNINWVDFVCERGSFIVFNKTVSINSFPFDSAYDYICKENKNTYLHYKLQRELGWFR